MTIEILPCGNTDSCEPGALHAFPTEGTWVRLTVDTYPLAGEGDTVRVPLGTLARVTEDRIEEAHLVGVEIAGVLLWADVDDEITILKEA